MSGEGTPREVFWAFLRLGLTSFGGPVAHLGYFRETLVLRRRWIDEQGYADLVALCQFLPGPASSQTGFALGVLRTGGLAGGIAAWCGFTLPSALALLACALGAAALAGPEAAAVLHGLKLVAVAVVAQAVWGMAHALAPDRTRAAIALAAMALVAGVGGAAGQVGAIVLGAAAGLVLCRGAADGGTALAARFPIGGRAAAWALAAAVVLLAALPLLAELSGWTWLAQLEAFTRAGALVFGGGHVVLPLLQEAVVAPGWVGEGDFLAGYGLAQAVPGPLFTFAAWLGAVGQPAQLAIPGGLLALLAIFLPGLLLVYGALPFWDGLRGLAPAQAAMRGANAAVVGILGAALYSPVFAAGIGGPRDLVVALAGFLLLVLWRLPSWAVVPLVAAAGAGVRLLPGGL